MKHSVSNYTGLNEIPEGVCGAIADCQSPFERNISALESLIRGRKRKDCKLLGCLLKGSTLNTSFVSAAVRSQWNKELSRRLDRDNGQSSYFRHISIEPLIGKCS